VSGSRSAAIRPRAREPLFALVAAVAASSFVPCAARAQSATVVTPEVGGAPWSATDLAGLRRDLDGMLARAPAVRGAHVGVVAVETGNGTVLYDRDGGDAFQPASTLKLVVGSAALERLGVDYRFRTTAYRAGDALVLRGGGDPFLTARDLAAMAAAVAQAGTSSLPGGVVVDAGRYDRVPHAPGWTWDDFVYDYAAPISALTLEENVLHLTVTPGAAAGAAATVGSAPLADAVGPVCTLGGAGSVVARATTLASGSEDTLDLTRGLGCVEVVGGIPLGAPAEQLDAAVSDPEAYARRVAVQVLAAQGVEASATPAPSGAFTNAAAAPLWAHDSPPLAQILPKFWIPSDNLVGELLLKELGYVTGGAPGTWAKGVAFETAWLRSIGVDPGTTTLADGSGLSQYDRITPRELVAILQHDWNGPNRQLVLDSLPVGGARGTIEGIAGTDAAGRVFAKTGSMSHVRGLAGYASTKRHGAVTFAFNVDDWSGDYPSLAALRAAVLSRIVDD